MTDQDSLQMGVCLADGWFDVGIVLIWKEKTVHFGVDALSRRSMLLHVPVPGDECQVFILTSARSALARSRNIPFVALDGGQRGRLDLGKLVQFNDGLDATAALHLRPGKVRTATTTC